MDGMTLEPACGGLFGNRTTWGWTLAVAAVAGCFLGLIGPFGSYLNGSRWLVVAYWMGCAVLGAVLLGGIVRPALRLAPRWLVPMPVALVGATMVAAVAIAVGCRLAAMRLWPGPISGVGWGEWYLETLIISAPYAVSYVVPWRRLGGPVLGGPVLGGPVGVVPAAGVVSRQGFLSRLPAHLGRELVALKMEDHYVRAHTAVGSALILIPLHQAIAELAGVDGVRVHRSWWVAPDKVAGAVQDGRNVRLLLSNGVEAPVSRANVAVAREAGLLRSLG